MARIVSKLTGAVAPNKVGKSLKGKGKSLSGPGSREPKLKPEVTAFNESTVEAINRAGPKGHEIAHILPREGRLLEALGGSGKEDPKTKIKSYAIVGGKGNKLPKGEGRGRVDSSHQVAVLTDPEVEALNTLRWKDKDRGYSSGSGPEIMALADQNDRPFDFLEYRGEIIPTLNDSSSDDLVGNTDSSGNTTYTYTGGGDGGGETAWERQQRLDREAAERDRIRPTGTTKFGKVWTEHNTWVDKNSDAGHIALGTTKGTYYDGKIWTGTTWVDPDSAEAAVVLGTKVGDTRDEDGTVWEGDVWVDQDSDEGNIALGTLIGTQKDGLVWTGSTWVDLDSEQGIKATEGETYQGTWTDEDQAAWDQEQEDMNWWENFMEERRQDALRPKGELGTGEHAGMVWSADPSLYWVDIDSVDGANALGIQKGDARPDGTVWTGSTWVDKDSVEAANATGTQEGDQRDGDGKIWTGSKWVEPNSNEGAIAQGLDKGTYYDGKIWTGSTWVDPNSVEAAEALGTTEGTRRFDDGTVWTGSNWATWDSDEGSVALNIETGTSNYGKIWTGTTWVDPKSNEAAVATGVEIGNRRDDQVWAGMENGGWVDKYSDAAGVATGAEVGNINGEGKIWTGTTWVDSDSNEAAVATGVEVGNWKNGKIWAGMENGGWVDQNSEAGMIAAESAGINVGDTRPGGKVWAGSQYGGWVDKDSEAGINATTEGSGNANIGNFRDGKVWAGLANGGWVDPNSDAGAEATDSGDTKIGDTLPGGKVWAGIENGGWVESDSDAGIKADAISRGLEPGATGGENEEFVWTGETWVDAGSNEASQVDGTEVGDEREGPDGTQIWDGEIWTDADIIYDEIISTSEDDLDLEGTDPEQDTGVYEDEDLGGDTSDVGDGYNPDLDSDDPVGDAGEDDTSVDDPLDDSLDEDLGGDAGEDDTSVDDTDVDLGGDTSDVGDGYDPTQDSDDPVGDAGEDDTSIDDPLDDSLDEDLGGDAGDDDTSVDDTVDDDGGYDPDLDTDVIGGDIGEDDTSVDDTVDDMDDSDEGFEWWEEGGSGIDPGIGDGDYDEDEGWGDDDDDGTDDTTQDDNDDDDPTTGDDDTADDTDDDDPTGVDKDKLLADLEKKYEKYNETDYNELFDAEFRDDLKEDYNAAVRGLEMAFLQSGNLGEFNTEGNTVNDQLDALEELFEGEQSTYLDEMAGDFASGPDMAIEEWYEDQKDKIESGTIDSIEELDLSEWSDPSENYDPEFFGDLDYNKMYDDPDKQYYGSIRGGTDPVNVDPTQQEIEDDDMPLEEDPHWSDPTLGGGGHENFPEDDDTTGRSSAREAPPLTPEQEATIEEETTTYPYGWFEPGGGGYEGDRPIKTGEVRPDWEMPINTDKHPDGIPPEITDLEEEWEPIERDPMDTTPLSQPEEPITMPDAPTIEEETTTYPYGWFEPGGGGYEGTDELETAVTPRNAPAPVKRPGFNADGSPEGSYPHGWFEPGGGGYEGEPLEFDPMDTTMPTEPIRPREAPPLTPEQEATIEEETTTYPYGWFEPGGGGYEGEPMEFDPMDTTPFRTEPIRPSETGRFMSEDMFQEKYPDKEYMTDQYGNPIDSTSDTGGTMPYGWQMPYDTRKHPDGIPTTNFNFGPDTDDEEEWEPIERDPMDTTNFNFGMPDAPTLEEEEPLERDPMDTTNNVLNVNKKKKTKKKKPIYYTPTTGSSGYSSLGNNL